MRRSQKKRNPLHFFIACAIFMICVTFIIMLSITIGGLRENIFPADVLIVLGNEVYADGTCSPRLAARLDRANEIYRSGFSPLIIVSGGIGRSGYDEAIAMRDYLRARDIPEEAIVVDSSGHNTRATARFAADYMRERGMSRAIAISQYFHLPRTVMALRKEGVPDIGRAYARYVEARDVFSIFREVPAYFAYAFGIK